MVGLFMCVWGGSFGLVFGRLVVVYFGWLWFISVGWFGNFYAAASTEIPTGLDGPYTY